MNIPCGEGEDKRRTVRVSRERCPQNLDPWKFRSHSLFRVLTALRRIPRERERERKIERRRIAELGKTTRVRLPSSNLLAPYFWQPVLHEAERGDGEMQRGARFSKRHTTPIAIRGLAFRSGNQKLRGLECVRALRGRWERGTRNNLSRNSDGKRENSGREQWGTARLSAQREVLVSNPTFHQFPKRDPSRAIGQPSLYSGFSFSPLPRSTRSSENTRKYAIKYSFTYRDLRIF